MTTADGFQGISVRFDFAVQRACIWSGVALLALFMIGIVTAGFLPPPRPGASAEHIQAMFVDHRIRIRIGMSVTIIGGTLQIPWVTAISLQMARIEGRLGPLSIVQLAAGWFNLALFLGPPVLWLVAAYRPATRAPDITRTLNDLAWLPFIGVASLVILQNVSIGLAAFGDRRERPVFPRWYGYYNFWTAVLYLPALFVFFFKDGPFAWNGAFAFWLVLAVIGTWYVVTAVVLFGAVKDEERSLGFERGVR